MLKWIRGGPDVMCFCVMFPIFSFGHLLNLFVSAHFGKVPILAVHFPQVLLFLDLRLCILVKGISINFDKLVSWHSCDRPKKV